MRIGQKLILGYVGIALLAVLVGTICIVQNKKSQHIFEEQVYRSISYLDDVWKLMEAQEHQEIAANNYLFLDEGLEEKRANYFYAKENMEKIYQKYRKEACEHAKPWIERYHENIKRYNIKAEESFELYQQGADPELIKATLRQANKYAETAHEDALEPIIEHVYKAHLEPAKQDIAKGINKTTSVTIIMSMVAIFLAIVEVGLFVSRSISAPITKLEHAAVEIGRGKLDTKIEIKSNDEIGQLAASFNKMTKDLKATTTSIDNLNREIAHREQAEKELEISNHDLTVAMGKLEETNRKLTDFVYIASHDLREPLRKISSFGQLLKQSLEGSLADDDKENLGFMVDGADRMTTMIEGLLTYSRVDTQWAEFETVDLNEIVKQLEQLEFAELLEETGGRIEVPEPLPEVQADPVQISQLLQNLIVNGIKYRHEVVQPRIVVRAKQIDKDTVKIEVQDNGIGIDEKHYENIFTMFKRLHPRQKYEGTGIGLAVCKNIVERHNGRIGVESKVDEGSAFWFTLSSAKEVMIVS